MNDIGKIIQKDIVSEIEECLNKVGILHRIFSRCKGIEAAKEKIRKKDYESSGKKLQDFIGIRIATYFSDDIPFIIKILEDTFVIDNKQIDMLKGDYFGPVRTNMVFKIPTNWEKEFNNSYSSISQKIDSTFEVQIRSVLSEGWHEIEHDLRYKCLEDWEGQEDLSRHLNGIYATLETSDTSLLDLFHKLAFRNYKDRKWQALLRNKLRIRLKNAPLSQEILDHFDNNIELGKAIFKLDREKFLEAVYHSGISIPNFPNNYVFLINFFELKDVGLDSLTPSVLKEKFTKIQPIEVL